MPMSRTCSSTPPTSTTIVSPSITATTMALPGSADGADGPPAHAPTRTRAESRAARTVASGVGFDWRPTGVGEVLQAFEDRAGAEPAAAAHADQGVLAAAALEL